MHKIRPEFYVNLHGKMHPTWPGVLIALHENGLLGIEVTALQYPTEENGGMAICQATVTMKGDGEREQIYTEIGDCSPKSTSPQIATAALRMAATRAKGRAGRDAIACGETLREELPDEEIEASRSNGHHAAPEPKAAPRARHDPQHHAEQKAAEPEPCAVCGDLVEPTIANAAVQRFAKVLCVDHGREEVARLKQVAATAAAG